MYVDKKMGNTQQEEEEDNSNSDDVGDEEEDEEEDSTKERHTPYFPNVMYRYEVGFTCRDMIPTFGMNQQVNVTREYYVDTGNGRGESRERNVVVCRGLQN